MDLRLVFLLLLLQLTTVESGLKGRLISCRNEGESIAPPRGTDNCIKCACRDQSVQCWKPKCPGTNHCHVLLPHKPKKSCCHICRGCLYEGRELLNGESYLSKDKCTEYTCKASVVTISPTKCHVPCDNPVRIPGQCCSVCPADHTTVKGGCFQGTTFIAPGEHTAWKGDHCTKCSCHNGKLSCTKRACPVLNCPDSKIVKDDKECCPKCEGSKQENYPTNGDCIFRGRSVQNGLEVRPDKCTQCMCKNGSTVCEREVCKVLDCPFHAIQHEKGECCPKCLEAKSCPADKTTDGQERAHDEQWKQDSCTTCHCYGGRVSCSTKSCDEKKPCPDNMIRVHLKGQCCSQCVPSDSRCTVSGSGSDQIQYTTFDRKHFKYQGVCKYVLATDSINQTFSVRIKQGYKTPKTFTVKLLHILFQTPQNLTVAVIMDTRLVVKVNKTVVRNGYRMPKVYIIEKDNKTVSLTLLALKVKVTLSADGYTEVIASRDWQSKLAGLCGDYNELSADDLQGKNGKVYTDSGPFASSWQVGGRCSCDEIIPEAERRTPCSAHPKLRLVARQQCDIFRSDVFRLCRDVINYRPYYLTCLDNVCTCEKNSERSCSCPTVTAYEKECHKNGLRIKLPQNACRKNTIAELENKESKPAHNQKLHEESRSTDVKSSPLPDKPLKKKSKSRKSNKNKRRQKSKSKLQSKDIERLKEELTKKHAKKQKPKPRGPDILLG